MGEPSSPVAASPRGAADRGDDTQPAQTLSVDTTQSTFEFVGRKVVGSQTAHFGEWRGDIELGGTIEASRIAVEIQMASVEADHPRLTEHLRTDDFFDVARFPTARFESTAFASAGEGDEDATHRVTGELTIRGRTQTITFPAHITLGAAGVRARATFTIDRKRWGVDYRGMEDNLIQDDVLIRFDLRAPRAAG